MRLIRVQLIPKIDGTARAERSLAIKTCQPLREVMLTWLAPLATKHGLGSDGNDPRCRWSVVNRTTLAVALNRWCYAMASLGPLPGASDATRAVHVKHGEPIAKLGWRGELLGSEG
jgi:hypothetical protein